MSSNLAQFCLGGPISRQQVDGIQQLLPHYAVENYEEFLCIEDSEFGDFHELSQHLQKEGIAYEVRYESDNGNTWLDCWAPGMELPLSFSTHDGDVVVTKFELQHCATLEDALSLVAAPDLPPLELVK